MARQASKSVATCTGHVPKSLPEDLRRRALCTAPLEIALQSLGSWVQGPVLGRPNGTVGKPGDTVGTPNGTVEKSTDTVGKPNHTVGKPGATVINLELPLEILELPQYPKIPKTT